MSVEERLARLEAREECWKLIARYARAVDEENDELLQEIYAPDVVSETIPWFTGKQNHGRDIVVKSFKNYQGAFKNRKRFITNELIDVTGPDSATGWANWIVLHASGDQSYVGWGAYEWDFACRDGKWLITRMVIKVDAMTTLEKGWADAEKLVAPFPTRPKR